MILIESLLFLPKFISNKPVPNWLISFNSENDKIIKDPCKRMLQHPMLSRIHDHNNECVIPGGHVDGEYVFYNSYSKNKPAIITYGGSTTDGMRIDISNGDTWPKLLDDIVKKDGLTVVNGGVASHGSTQTNLKMNFLKNSIPNKIEAIISLEGINEIKGSYSDKTPYSGLGIEENSNWPYLTDNLLNSYLYEQWFIINKEKIILFPNIQRKISKISSRAKKAAYKKYLKNISSTKKEIYSPAEIWEMNAYKNFYLAKAYKSNFILLIQPSMGVTEKQIPNEEIRDSNDWIIYHNSNPKYFENMRLFYNQIKSKCMNMSFCFDLSNSVTPLTGNLFKDYRHHNEHGNKILSEDIFKILLSQKIVNENEYKKHN